MAPCEVEYWGHYLTEAVECRYMDADTPGVRERQGWAAPWGKVSRDPPVTRRQVRAVALHRNGAAAQEEQRRPVTIARVSHESSDRRTRFTVMRQVRGQAGKSRPWVRLWSSELHDRPQARLQHSSGQEQKLCLPVLTCSSQGKPEGPSFLQLLLTQHSVTPGLEHRQPNPWEGGIRKMQLDACSVHTSFPKASAFDCCQRLDTS